MQEMTGGSSGSVSGLFETVKGLTAGMPGSSGEHATNAPGVAVGEPEQDRLQILDTAGSGIDDFTAGGNNADRGAGEAKTRALAADTGGNPESPGTIRVEFRPVGGDVFSSRKITQEDRQYWQDWFHTVRENVSSADLLPGFHDVSGLPAANEQLEEVDQAQTVGLGTGRDDAGLSGRAAHPGSFMGASIELDEMAKPSLSTDPSAAERNLDTISPAGPQSGSDQQLVEVLWSMADRLARIDRRLEEQAIAIAEIAKREPPGYAGLVGSIATVVEDAVRSARVDDGLATNAASPLASEPLRDETQDVLDEAAGQHPADLSGKAWSTGYGGLLYERHPLGGLRPGETLSFGPAGKEAAGQKETITIRSMDEEPGKAVRFFPQGNASGTARLGEFASASEDRFGGMLLMFDYGAIYLK